MTSKASAGKEALPAGIDRILIPAPRIAGRVEELGRQISEDYAGRDLLLIGVLKGSVVFLADLVRRITIPCSIDFISLSSYSGTTSSGVVQLLLDLQKNPEGRDLLLVEDVVDTGLTLSYLFQNLKTRRPKTLEVCAFLDKPSRRKTAVKPKYVGFQIPNEFVVGYGLDFNERYRNLPHVGVYKEPS
ncbi:MAG: hypoxanthine phosphoribosyltransferase [Elusimicrobia bacterium]|nr:hypoxanthine phosphoribosyltransferase [Elusimicrobiota bacterium]